MMSLALWQWMAIIGVPVVTVITALLLLWQQQRRLRLQAEQQNTALEQDAEILRERIDELQHEVYEKDSHGRKFLVRKADGSTHIRDCTSLVHLELDED